MSHQSAVPVSDEIWSLLKETQKNLKEVSANQKELQDSHKEARQEMQEIRAIQKETDQQMKELTISHKETNQQMKEIDKQINDVIGDSGNGWGKLGENLVKGSLAQQLKERGIEVERVITNAKNAFTEFDIIAINEKEAVVVEVKATLDPSDVKEFTENLKNFTNWWPVFKNKTIYGAMAFLIKSNNKSASHLAQKQGFFVVDAIDDVIIQNEKDFTPKVFS